MREITRLKSQIETWDGLEAVAAEVLELAELANADDAEMLAEVSLETTALTHRLDALDVQLLLSGEFDAHQAFLTIQSGAGWYGKSRLGRDAAAHVLALGGAAQVRRRRDRYIAGR